MPWRALLGLPSPRETGGLDERLEPFALDLWRNEITRWLPRIGVSDLRKTTFFGGLYQKVVITR